MKNTTEQEKYQDTIEKYNELVKAIKDFYNSTNLKDQTEARKIIEKHLEAE